MKLNISKKHFTIFSLKTFLYLQQIYNSMKNNIFTALFCFLSVLAFSQQKIAADIKNLEENSAQFRNYTLFTKINTSSTDVSEVLKDATYLNLDLQKLQTIYNAKNDYIDLEIPYKNELKIVRLYKTNPLTHDFTVDTNKQKNIPVEAGLFYRGIVKDDYESLVTFSFFRNQCFGIISQNNTGNIIVGQLKQSVNQADYVAYSDSEMKVFDNFECHTEDKATNVSSTELTNKNSLTTRCVTVYFEVDYDLYVDNGSNTTTTTNWLTAMFNQVKTLYNNDGIDVAIKSMFIWTDLDPYDGVGTSSGDYLYAFNGYRPVFNGDVGQLIGKDAGGLGGVAVGINGLCTTNNFSYSDLNGISYNNVPTYSWNIMVITHELGHLFGSPHTHACRWNGNNTAIDNCGPYARGANTEGGTCMTTPATLPSSGGTIMSYCHLVSSIGINLNNGFGAQPRTRIQNAINAGTCLSTDCVNTCINTVTAMQINSSDSSATTFSWVDTINSTWQVAVYPYGSTPSTWTTVTTNSYTATGLAADTYYVAAIKPVCPSGLDLEGAQTFFASPGDFCSGMQIYDIGGSFSNYEDRQNVVRVLMPNLPNKLIKVTFTEFDFELDYDYLYVYNGNSIGAPIIGAYTGDAIPAPITSSAADGSLTIQYISDPYLNYSGYAATVSCEQNLSTDDNTLIDFTYFPNPSNDKVTINSKNEFNNLRIYSVTGQLLYTDTKEASSKTVDISQFASGVYFFKLQFGSKEVDFKILKP